MASLIQIFFGILVLITGALVYITDRPSDTVVMIEKIIPALSMYGEIPSIFGSMGCILPGFAHTFSFSMFMGGLFGRTNRDYRIICIFWSVVNCLFEIGQKFSNTAATVSPFNLMRSYFEHGTFDPLDIVAIITGGLISYVLLVTIRKKESVL